MTTTVVLFGALTALLGCDGRPDMSGTFTHPVTGYVHVGDDAQPLSGPWTVQVTRRGGWTYEVSFQGCSLSTEPQVNGVAEFTPGQECTVTLPDGVRASVRLARGQIDHRSDFIINLSLRAEGATMEDEPRSVSLQPLFPGGP